MSNEAESKKKTEIYSETKAQINAVLANESNHIARMSTVVCLLTQAFDYYYWCGFYSIDPEKPKELVVGPYQGTLGCLRIPFSRGVCGSAAESRKTIIVADVHQVENHIACDPNSTSEIVIPAFDKENNLFGVLDVDSKSQGSFDNVDSEHLNEILTSVFR